jgi:hypothetical protein
LPARAFFSRDGDGLEVDAVQLRFLGNHLGAITISLQHLGAEIVVAARRRSDADKTSGDIDGRRR